MRQFFLAALRDLFDVLPAASVEDALAVIASPARLAAVLCDLNLGGGEEGLDVLRAARRQQPTALRILISGQVSPGLVDAAEAASLLYAFLRKPVRLTTLRQAIQAQSEG